MNPNKSPEKLDGDLQLQLAQEVEQLNNYLEKGKIMGSKLEMVKYQNFWVRSSIFKIVLYFQKQFKAHDSDIILVSQPKTGTTWLKSLLFTIANRFNSDHQPLSKNSPLLSHNPHELVYILEHGVYGGKPPFPNPRQLEEHPSPRLLQTHLPYASLPETIKTSTCKIIYISRNPFDTFVSHWNWHGKLIKTWGGDPEFQFPSIEDFFDDFCLGKFPFGPYFEHVSEFWKLSEQQPNKVLFLKYEDLKGDHAVLHLKKLAEFMEFPFSDLEENEGIINDIMQLCSITNLKEVEVNKTGFTHNIIENKNFFRKGEVGDWTNYFTPSMVERLNILIHEYFGGTGLCFQLQ